MLETRIPKKLVKGDTIGLIAPSSDISKEDLEVINNSVMLMEVAGFNIKFAKNALKNTLGYGATAEEKAEDINEMFRDEEVKAIFCISGGFNSNVVFEYLNYDFIRNHPKIICGFSDSTSLTNNIYSQTGVVTFSGPTFKALTSWQTQYGYEEVIKRFVEGGLVLGQADDKYKTIKEGKAKGILVGGNLSLLNEMISGKYSIDFTDKIVFMEELFLETPPALVSNYFYHMKQNGIFDRIKGIWLGNYDGSVAIEKILIDTIGNEYVWIEVPKTAEVYPTAGLEITNFTKAEYKAIETDLHTYTDYYRKNKSGTLTKYKDEYYSEATTGLTRAKYTELKQKMLKSVYENGGFWIGRYEAGIEKNRTSSTIDLATAPAPLSKAGTVKNAVYPYTYVKCSQAQTLASKLSTGKSYTSSLMFGVQWDLVLKHIEVKEVAKGTDLAKIQKALRNDSKDWGNYCNATFTINRGEYAEYKNYTLSTTWTPYNQTTSNNFVNSNVKQDQSGGNGGILLTTGASDACKKMNIYDLAGNVWEWTLEYTALTSGPCAGRGGSFLNDGSLNPASGRNFVSTTVSNESIGFRPSLFK